MNAFVRWKNSCWCVEAAQLDAQAAPFLLNEHLPVDVRFELAIAILHPVKDREGRSLH
jgi:hypothetical protein